MCTNAKRDQIERACENGTSLADVATTFRLSETSLARHISTHARVEAQPSAVESVISIPTGRAAPARSRAPSPPPDLEEEAPATSRSRVLVPPAPAPAPATARVALDAILCDVQMLTRQVNAADVPFADKAAAIRAALTAARLLGALTGELGASESAVATSPHYRRIRAAIVEELRAYPAAAKAVVLRLEREEGITAVEAAA